MFEQIKKLWDIVYDIFIKISKFVFNKKLLFWFFLIGLFIPPFILAMPLPLYSSILNTKNKKNSEEIIKEVPIPQNVQSMGVSFFSKISGIETYIIPTMICVLNRNIPLLDNEVKDPRTLVDSKEAGAMEIHIKYPSGADIPLYAPRKFLPSCKELQTDISTSSLAYLTDNSVFRLPLPFGQPIFESSENGPIIKVPVYQTSGVDFSKTAVFAITRIYSKEFVLNITIFFVAWSLVYLHLIKLCLFCGKVHSWAYLTKLVRHKNRKVLKK